MRIFDRWFCVAMIAAFAGWAACAAFDVAGQRKMFFESGARALDDFWMPRMCLEQGYAANSEVALSGWRELPDGGSEFVTGSLDKVYPALALLPLAAFPATQSGGWTWTCCGAAVFLLACLVCARKGGRDLLALAAVACSMPFVFSIERGNPIWLSAAAVAVFFAWWDDEKPWRRYCAAACLAFAAAIKIAPAALGILYVVRWFRFRDGFREALFAAVLAVALFLVPWLFVGEGFAAIPVMIANAARHADYVLRTSDFGLVQIWRCARLALGMDVMSPWPGMVAAARISQLAGLAVLIRGAWRRDLFLLAAGMLFAVGNMYYYGALYLIPALLLMKRPSVPSVADTVFALLAFVALMPWQVVAFGRSGNDVLCNVAVMLLCAIRWRDRVG